VADRYVSVSILSDPNPGFKVTVYLQVEHLKTVYLRDKVTTEH